VDPDVACLRSLARCGADVGNAWLTLPPRPPPARCTPLRVPGCGWDACDPALQALLESSCQVCHPGSAAPHALPAPRLRAAPLCEPRGRRSGRQRSSARAPPAQGPFGTELAHCWEQPLPVRSPPPSLVLSGHAASLTPY